MTRLEDMYGNPVQNETPTTRLLKARSDNRIQSTGKVWHYGGAAYPSVTHAALVAAVEQILGAVKVPELEGKRFRFEFNFEEEVPTK